MTEIRMDNPKPEINIVRLGRKSYRGDLEIVLDKIADDRVTASDFDYPYLLRRAADKIRLLKKELKECDEDLPG